MRCLVASEFAPGRAPLALSRPTQRPGVPTHPVHAVVRDLGAAGLPGDTGARAATCRVAISRCRRCATCSTLLRRAGETGYLAREALPLPPAIERRVANIERAVTLSADGIGVRSRLHQAVNLENGVRREPVLSRAALSRGSAGDGHAAGEHREPTRRPGDHKDGRRGAVAASGGARATCGERVPVRDATGRAALPRESFREVTMDAFARALGAIATGPWSNTAIPALRITLIAVVAWFAARAIHRAIRVVRERIAHRLDGKEQVKRAETIGRVLRYIVSVVVSLIAGVLVLSELGVSIAPILGAAGVVGLAIGFGAQSLVKDYFTGFFILLENQLTTGDVVEVGGKSGLVEDVTLRYVRLRDYDGNVHYVPNSLITTVTNMSRGYAQSVIDVGVAYREDVDQVLDVMREVGGEMRGDAVFGPKILDTLEIAGVDRLADSAVVLRCRFRVLPLEQWNVRREFLRRLKNVFDARGIEIPFPHVTLYAGVGRDGSAPPLPIVATVSSGGR